MWNARVTVFPTTGSNKKCLKCFTFEVNGQDQVPELQLSHLYYGTVIFTCNQTTILWF